MNSKNTDTNVLFQKMGNTWFIYAEIDNEIIYSAMPEGMDPRETKLELYHVIEEHMKNISRDKQRQPEVA